MVSATPGAVNAATDEFTVTVTGRGGHSGYPHTVDDSVLALSAVVVALQQVGARRIDPTVGVACMVNQVRAGSANNVVPGSAVGSGTVRTMRAEDREMAHRAIIDIATAVAAGHGCTAEVSIERGEPVLVNDIDLAVRAGEVLTSLGRAVDPTFRSFGSDDFSHYGATMRSLMMFVGTGSERGGLHDASYLPDDAYVAMIAEALVAGYCAAVARDHPRPAAGGRCRHAGWDSRRRSSTTGWCARSTRSPTATGCWWCSARARSEARPLLDAYDVTIVVAHDWAEGMGASLAAGLGHALHGEENRCLVTLVDLPDVGRDVVRRVLAEPDTDDVLARASYAGVPGHPVLLGRAHWAGVLATSEGDKGARDYLRAHPPTDVECGDLATGRDVDQR